MVPLNLGKPSLVRAPNVANMVVIDNDYQGQGFLYQKEQD